MSKCNKYFCHPASLIFIYEFKFLNVGLIDRCPYYGKEKRSKDVRRTEALTRSVVGMSEHAIRKCGMPDALRISLAFAGRGNVFYAVQKSLSLFSLQANFSGFWICYSM